MRLNQGLHLAYCTNVHPGEDWAQTMDSLVRWTLPVKEQLQRDGPFAIGLRLSARAAAEIAEPGRLRGFQRWLEQNNCYVFTINGFPFGRFHAGRVKEDVYRPDWSDPRRLDYTKCLFDILAELLPAGVEGSVSTLPGSFKEFISSPEQTQSIRDNLWHCVEHIAALSDRTGKKLHLGLEPEPLGLFENTIETVDFFGRLGAEHANDPRISEHLGVNYDTCHFAIQYEEPAEAIGTFQQHGIRLSKIHISNALKLTPSPAALGALQSFAEDVYLHQVVARSKSGELTRFKDLDIALAHASKSAYCGEEWRVHFHIPLHSRPPGAFDSTADHVLSLIKLLKAQPTICPHLEMETYTWAVLPDALKTRSVSDQIVAEYEWTLRHLADSGLSAI